MPYAPFWERFPEVAKQETRSIIIQENTNVDLPPGEYGLLELYCDKPGCDCRRVMFYVATPSRTDPEAVVAWGWESRDFYARWMGSSDPEDIDELQGPILNLASPQSARAPAILDLIENVVLRDPEYVERIKRHYRMFRETIDDKARARRRRKEREKKKRKKRR